MGVELEWVGNACPQVGCSFVSDSASLPSLLFNIQMSIFLSAVNRKKSCYNFSFILFSNLLSRPTHGQHRHDGIKTEQYKTGHHSPREQMLGSKDPMARGPSPRSSHISPDSSTVSLPSNFLCHAHSLPSMLDINDASFSDVLSDCMNDQEEFVSSVWKHSDLNIYFIFYFKLERVFCFCFISYRVLVSALYYFHTLPPYSFTCESTFSQHDLKLTFWNMSVSFHCC